MEEQDEETKLSSLVQLLLQILVSSSSVSAGQEPVCFLLEIVPWMTTMSNGSFRGIGRNCGIETVLEIAAVRGDAAAFLHLISSSPPAVLFFLLTSAVKLDLARWFRTR